MNLQQAYSYSVKFLEANNIDEADFKALNTVCHVAGIKNSEYALHKDDFIITRQLADCLWKLKTGMPLQYVLGKWDFYESEFKVGEGVLIPRPETEELVELVIKCAKKTVNPIIIDLCSGSGCIGISIARAVKNSTVYCVEKSEDALKYLIENSKGDDNVKVVCGDIFNDIDLPTADIIVSNPPYIKSNDIKTLQDEVKKEPHIALDGGEDGLDFYRCINEKWHNKVKNGGYLFLEIGNEQGGSVSDILTNFNDINVKKDLYGNDRMVVAIKTNR